MDTIVTPGLVLKETRYKESDRILTILTPELGVISASAQSSLRLKNKLFSACGLFCYSEFVLLQAGICTPSEKRKCATYFTAFPPPSRG